MTTVQFCYWLQGLFELSDVTELNADQTLKIKQHLAMVFIHDIDPSYPKDQQQALNTAHAGSSSGKPTQPPGHGAGALHGQTDADGNALFRC